LAYQEDDDKIVCAVDVRPDVRRQGIASQMYQFVEKITGKVVYPEKNHSASANKFWNQQNRKFGPKDISGRANVKPEK
jgi:GNAT superfamily N-acetyltransferase